MMFDDDEASVPIEGAPEGESGRTGAATARARREASRVPRPAAHPPAYRLVVADWPEDWRERWGRRSNELEELGLSWRDAEAQAFVEIWGQVRGARHGDGSADSGVDPERN